MPYSDDALRAALQHGITIAVVGLSPDASRPSHRVARYLMAQGYRIIPVNPQHSSLLGQPCYPTLSAIPEPVHMVDVFRKAADTPAIADEAVAIGARTLWLQLGVVNTQAQRRAESAGLRVVMDRCTKIEHERLFGVLP